MKMKIVSFFVLFTAALCNINCAQDGSKKNTFHENLSTLIKLHGGSTASSDFFVGIPADKDKQTFVFLPWGKFDNDYAQSNPIGEITLYLFVFNNETISNFGVKIEIPASIRDKLQSSLQKERIDRYNASDYKEETKFTSVSSMMQLQDQENPTLFSPNDSDLKSFLTNLNNLFQTQSLPEESSARFFLYGNDLKQFRLACFKSTGSTGWIGDNNGKVCECYCKFPSIEKFEKLFPISSSIDLSTLSLIAIDSKSAFKTTAGDVKFESLTWKKGDIEKYYKDNKFILKDSISDLPKEITKSLAEPESWSDNFRQNPAVPFKVQAR